jgi:peptidoglycan hydrolase CwlO-like protein
LEYRLDLAKHVINDVEEEKEELQRQLDEARAAPEKLKTQLRNEHERMSQLQDSNRRLREQIARGGDSGKQRHGGGKRGGWGGGGGVVRGEGGFANWC